MGSIVIQRGSDIEMDLHARGRLRRRQAGRRRVRGGRYGSPLDLGTHLTHAPGPHARAVVRAPVVAEALAVLFRRAPIDVPYRSSGACRRAVTKAAITPAANQELSIASRAASRDQLVQRPSAT
jgi:hypothetical protein